VIDNFYLGLALSVDLGLSVLKLNNLEWLAFTKLYLSSFSFKNWT
jgi:hypothetical protein